MANSSSKGLTIGIIALVVVVGLIFAISRHGGDSTSSPEVATASKESTPPADQKSADAKDTPTQTASASDTKGNETKSDAGGDELTSPAEDSQAADASKAAEASKDDKSDAKTADKTEDKKDDKSATSPNSGNGSLLAGPAALDVDVDKAMADRSIGSSDAPVTMIEYASLTCPHCAHFSNDLLPEVKKQLIDTGKMRLIYRDYPLDTYAMKAALMARCADPDKYFDLIEVIFKNQERWVKNADPVKGLIQLGALAGMNEDYIKSCMANEELQSAILARVQDAQKNYKLDSTPTFIFNNGAEKMSGDKEVEDFVNVVKKLSGK